MNWVVCLAPNQKAQIGLDLFLEISDPLLNVIAPNIIYGA